MKTVTSEAGARAVFDLIRSVEQNTKAGFERRKPNVKKETKDLEKVLRLIYGRAPTVAEIEMAHAEIWAG